MFYYQIYTIITIKYMLLNMTNVRGNPQLLPYGNQRTTRGTQDLAIDRCTT